MPYTPTTWADGSGGGTPITAAALNNMEDGIVDAHVSTELAYTEFNSNVTISATTDATSNTIVTAGPVTFDGATIAIIEFSAMINVGTGGEVIVSVFEDGVSLGFFADVTAPAAGALNHTVFARRRLTPAAGSRTYSIRAWRITTNATVLASTGGPGSRLPGYIRIVSV